MGAQKGVKSIGKSGQCLKASSERVLLESQMDNLSGWRGCRREGRSYISNSQECFGECFLVPQVTFNLWKHSIPVCLK